jgi:hypothetical protein
MNAEPLPIGIGTLLRATTSALQWRLLVLWLAGLWLPTAIVSLPIMLALSHQLDHSLLAASLATGFDAAVFADLVMAITDNLSAIHGAALIATILTLLLSPLLTGMAVTAIRSGGQPGFTDLLHGGFVEYGRLLRMQIWGGILLGIAMVVGVLIVSSVDKSAERAIVASEFEGKARWALVAAIALVALVHATLEAGRAQLAADATLRSALRAWWRGVKQVVRRPISTLGFYVVISAVGYLAIAGFGRWRISLAGGQGLGFVVAFGVTQLVSLASAWVRIARLHALTEIARAR